jgi:UDP-N-acetylglucosamine 2-epimerase (non-hydrolysing)
MTMPEEINRMVTDAITDLFFTTEKTADINLVREGKSESAIHFVGHVMIDNLLYQKKIVDANGIFPASQLKKSLGNYIFLTLHRPSTVDNKDKLSDVVNALNEIAEEMPVVFPVHPRTGKMIEQFGITLSPHIRQFSPLGFRESLFWWKDAKMVFTDSGGLQEETTALGVPCYTIRNNTERPITITEGTNTLIGTTGDAVRNAYFEFKAGKIKIGSVPKFWDGMAAERIIDILLK